MLVIQNVEPMTWVIWVFGGVLKTLYDQYSSTMYNIQPPVCLFAVWITNISPAGADYKKSENILNLAKPTDPKP